MSTLQAASPGPATDHQRGLALTFIGGLLLTFDVPLVRLVEADPWTILFCRGVMVFAVTWTYWLFAHRLRGSSLPFVNGMDSVAAALCYAFGTLCLYLAIYHTSVANLVFILAFNPMFSAILSRIFLGEKIEATTLAAIVASLIGVLIIVYDGLGNGTLFGDMLSLGCAFFIACALTISRASRKDMSMMPAIAALLVGAFSTFLSQPWTLSPVQWGWMAMNGIVVMPLAMGLLALGTRYVSATEVAMFFLLETVITPVWMWLIFSENPSNGSLIGGAIILLSLFGHSLHKLVRQRAQRAQRAAQRALHIN